MVFRLTMHPASDGDCLTLTWGSPEILRHMIVDFGRSNTWSHLKTRLKEMSNIELVVITHIDADHIAGAVPMMREDTPAFRPKRIWFNSLPELEAAHRRRTGMESFGPRQGEKISRGIANFDWPRNIGFASGVVSVDSAEAADWIDLEGGLRLKLISPDDIALSNLLPEWERELTRASIRSFDPDVDPDPMADVFEALSGTHDVGGLANMKYEPDKGTPNGSSIAFIAEYGGKRVLLAADSHSEVVINQLMPIFQAFGPIHLDLFKVSHHGSRFNTSPAMLKLIDCCRFAFSTDGSREHRHPHAEAIARILNAYPRHKKTLYFNYRQTQTLSWDASLLKRLWNYNVVYPEPTENGTLTIDI